MYIERGSNGTEIVLLTRWLKYHHRCLGKTCGKTYDKTYGRFPRAQNSIKAPYCLIFHEVRGQLYFRLIGHISCTQSAFNVPMLTSRFVNSEKTLAAQNTRCLHQSWVN